MARRLWILAALLAPACARPDATAVAAPSACAAAECGAAVESVQRDTLTNAPSATQLRARAEAVDRDGDGLLDADDSCPDEPGLVPDGCPIRDSDDDRVLDTEDRCPRERETVNGFEDADGCPDELPSELAELVGVVEGVPFDWQKRRLKPSAYKALDHLVDVLRRYPDVRIAIEAHSAMMGRYQRTRPTQKYADAVARYLIDQGIAADRLRAHGMGDAKPIADNKTSEGRAKNRRLELILME